MVATREDASGAAGCSFGVAGLHLSERLFGAVAGSFAPRKKRSPQDVVRA